MVRRLQLMLAVGLVLPGCSRVEIDLGGRPCDAYGRCLEGWQCETATDSCMPAQSGCSDEVCDGFDNDCDGGIDEDLPAGTAYVDGDGDGHGGLGASAYEACVGLPGFAPVADDCDDADAARFPGAVDSVGDGIDQNCDGADGTFVPDFCNPDPCVNGSTCANGSIAASCTCLPGYSGPTCATNIDDCAGDPCLNGGTCFDGVTTFACTCAPGYSGPTCATDIDDCAVNPCLNGGTCIDGVASFTCNCAPTYSSPTCACETGPGVFIVPAGSDPCPIGSTEQTLETDPQAGSGACGCDTCTPTADPSCAGSNLSVTYGTNSCFFSLSPFNVSDYTCTDFGVGAFTITVYHGWTARTPTAGSCTAAPLTDVNQVTTTALRYCLPDTVDIACAAESTGMRLCIPQTSGLCSGKFSVPIVVGDGPDLSCGACSCSHSASTCTIEYHGNPTCTQLGWTTEANGVCTATNRAAGMRYFEIYPSGVTCNATPGAAMAGLTNPSTVCCTP